MLASLRREFLWLSPSVVSDSLRPRGLLPARILCPQDFPVLPVSCYQPISLHRRAHTISHVIPWTSARQTPLSMDFSRQEYWSGLPFPSPTIFILLVKNQHLVYLSITFKKLPYAVI